MILKTKEGDIDNNANCGREVAEIWYLDDSELPAWGEGMECRKLGGLLRNKWR